MGTYTAKERATSGTLKDPKTGKKTRFPIGDKTHAQLAVARENQAKPPLSSEEKATVNRKAAKYGVGPDKKPATKAKKS